jgi:sRNA-binding carbon storage regulator CsrA
VTREIEIRFGEAVEILPGILIKPIRLHGTEARIGVQAPRHVSVIKAESRDPDVIAFRSALVAIAGGVT